MAKKTTTTTEKKKKENIKVNRIDNLPKCTQQPRTPAPKRRRFDFSVFSYSSYSSSLCNSGSLLGPSSGGDEYSPSTSTSDNKKNHGKMLQELPLLQGSKSQGKRAGLFSKFFEAPVMESESVVQDGLVDHCADRKVGEATNHNAEIFQFTPKKSQVMERNGVCLTPGNVVWAKTACQMWWPAEIIEEKFPSTDPANQGIPGHVLVQFYGNCKSAWVDPARDLSEFEDCFEERSSNSTENFQDALRQAVLQRKEHLSSCQQFFHSPDRNHSDQQGSSSGKWRSSTSSRMVSDLPKSGKEKRERKPKIHFDEVTFPPKSPKKIRRLKIMRYLGLMAPIGSPF